MLNARNIWLIVMSSYLFIVLCSTSIDLYQYYKKDKKQLKINEIMKLNRYEAKQREIMRQHLMKEERAKKNQTRLKHMQQLIFNGENGQGEGYSMGNSPKMIHEDDDYDIYADQSKREVSD